MLQNASTRESVIAGYLFQRISHGVELGTQQAFFQNEYDMTPGAEANNQIFFKTSISSLARNVLVENKYFKENPKISAEFQ